MISGHWLRWKIRFLQRPVRERVLLFATLGVLPSALVLIMLPPLGHPSIDEDQRQRLLWQQQQLSDSVAQLQNNQGASTLIIDGDAVTAWASLADIRQQLLPDRSEILWQSYRQQQHSDGRSLNIQLSAHASQEPMLDWLASLQPQAMQLSWQQLQLKLKPNLPITITSQLTVTGTHEEPLHVQP